ncbi:hypothetical protein LZ31DRAFT_167904 [Colletotrichum somersetense]|nr:hypothetical protein LZ31DRAFT_167904 [Colletotrichum somersetense]
MFALPGRCFSTITRAWMVIAVLFAMWIRVPRHTCIFMHYIPKAKKKKSQPANRRSGHSSMFRRGILPHPLELVRRAMSFSGRPEKWHH